MYSSNINHLFESIIHSYLLPINDCNVAVLRSDLGKEHFIMRSVASLYDNLADAVDEINSIFSKVVRSNKFDFFFYILLIFAL